MVMKRPRYRGLAPRQCIEPLGLTDRVDVKTVNYGN